ncbi:uncharacterized protein [Dysidea avara]|uniref:uncharacterized protein n=1 Tax=Dysidea avara TaxID=196820 RepID=UPI003331DC07
MELVSITDSECVNDSFHNSFSDGCSDTKNMELGGEEQCNVSSDNPSPQNHDVPCRSPNCRQSSVEADEGCWLLEDEEYQFDVLDGISDISVDSAEYPLPEPKITLQSIAKRWLDKLTNEENIEPEDSVTDTRTDEANAVLPHQSSMEPVQEVEPVTSDPNNSRESCRSEEAEVVLHSTPASDSSVPPMLPPPSQEANSTFTMPVNSTFTKADESCTDKPIPQSTTQLQIPSTKNTVNEPLKCGEVALIRETCNNAITQDPPSEQFLQGDITDNSSKLTNLIPAVAKKVATVPIKPPPTRKLLLKKNTTSTVYKSPMKKPNRNQAHLVANQQETKLSKPTMSSHLKQKEPMAIKKSLLSKPIIMAKSAGKTDGTSLVPCKPAGLKRPAQKLNGTKDHPLQLATMPGHSTPIKDQTSRRRSVAVSPQRDSSAANDDRQAIPAKQRRRSGIPLPGGVSKVPMSPSNKNNNFKFSVGVSPVVPGKHSLQPPIIGKCQPRLPKPKTQLNFNTSFDILDGMDLEGPPPGGSKLMHSPAEKENSQVTAHSQWSPIRRNRGMSADEECIRCTKHTARFQQS